MKSNTKWKIFSMINLLVRQIKRTTIEIRNIHISDIKKQTQDSMI